MGKQNLKDMLRRLNKVFRFSIIEDDTHKQISSYRFSRLGLVTAVITFVVVIVILLYSVIAFTPLRTTIPGYPDAHFRKQAISNAIKIDSLESALVRWKLYSTSISRVLAGEQTLDLDSMLRSGVNRYLSDKSAEELARQDSLLRSTVREEEQFGVSESSTRTLPIEGMSFFTPIKGVVAQGFDMVLHPGVDISAPANSVVSAVLDGTVIFAGWADLFGYTVMIQHQNNIISLYRHNAKLLKEVGDKVGAGTPIALIGGTGSLATGEHLHLELWYRGEPVDPAKYISF